MAINFEFDIKTQFFKTPAIQLFILLLLFIVAFAVRMHHITQPPYDFATERQYQSAHIARSFYFESQDSIPEWRKNIAELNMKRMGLLLEPRILENLTVIGYRILGGERFWIPRVLSSIFWLIGGGFLYLIARRIASLEAALFSTAFYLFLPFSILASRSFQPDPLMLMLLIFSVFMVMRFYEQSSFPRLILAAMISTLAILAKPYSIFFIFGAFTAIGIYRDGIRRTFINKNIFLFVVLGFIPALSYYVYGILTSTGYLNELAQSSFLPHLILEPFYWKGWLLLIGQVVGYMAFVGALIGLLTMTKSLAKALLLGLWSGYFIFGLLFTMHIHTHDYYHLPFIPVVALSIGAPGALLVKYLLKQWKVTIAVCLIITGVAAGIMARLNLDEFVTENKEKLKIASNFIGVNPQFKNFIVGDFEREVQMAKEIGEIVGHSTNTVFLTHNFGRAIAYNGEFSGLPWPTSFSLRERRERGLKQLTKEELYGPGYLTIRTHGRYIKYTPDYFIITDFKELEEQSDLKEFLRINFSIIASKKDYLVYDLRKMSK